MFGYTAVWQGGRERHPVTIDPLNCSRGISRTSYDFVFEIVHVFPT